YVLDTTPPVAPTITSTPGSPGNDATPSWSFTGEAGATFTCSLTRGGVTVIAAASCTSPTAYDLPSQPDGTYTFTVTATDPPRQPAATSPSTVAAAAPACPPRPPSTPPDLLTTPPPAPSITAAPATPGNGRAPAWSFTGEAGATFDCSLTRGGVTVFPAAPCT